MSFSFEFTAKRSDAEVIVLQECAPADVKSFVMQALSAFQPDDLVFIKAYGHLYNRDHNYSSATISVTPLTLRVPK